MIRIFLLIFSLQFVFGQFNQKTNHNEKMPPMLRGIFYEWHLIPDNNSESLLFFIRLNYQSIVFQKSDDTYSANIQIQIEIKDTLGTTVKRKIVNDNIVAANYEESNNSKNFYQNFFKFEYEPSFYESLVTITDVSSQKEIPLPPHNVKKRIKKFDFYNPIVLFNSNDTLYAANFNGDIPFSSGSYSLLIYSNIQDDSIIVAFNNENYVEARYASRINYSYNVEATKNGIAFIKTNNKGNVFLIENINHGFDEGTVKINVASILDTSINAVYQKNVLWLNKPRVLFDSELAIKVIEVIENKNFVDSLLKVNRKNFKNTLNDYWSKLDPTPSTKFNELMEEFYRRVDYAIINLSDFGRSNGYQTDRGVIYIKFGKPDKIERTSSLNGTISEIWFYNKSNRKFIFIDKNGRYELVN